MTKFQALFRGFPGRICGLLSKYKQLGRFRARFKTVAPVTRKNTNFWDATPCIYQRFILNMKADHSSETSADFYQNALRQIPENVFFTFFIHGISKTIIYSCQQIRLPARLIHNAAYFQISTVIYFTTVLLL